MAKAETVKQKPAATVKKPVATTNRIYYIIVFAFSFLLYANTLPNDYNLDDELVTQNHRLTSKGISAIPEIFTSPYYEDENGYSYEYRPIVLTTFAIEHSIFGDNPHVGHFINTLLYALLCILLLKVLSTVFNQYNFWLSFIAVLLFVAYPMHTEIVSSIKNRDEILALGFGLGSVYYAFLFTQNKKWLYTIPVFVLFSLGLLSKSTIVPFVLLLPLALITFSHVKLGRALVIYALLIIPVFFTGKLFLLTQYIAILLLLAVIIILYYAVIRKTNFKTYLQNIFSQLKQAPTETKEGFNLQAIDFKPLFIALGISIPVIAGLYLCVTHILYWPAVIASILFSLMFILFPPKITQYLFIPFLSSFFGVFVIVGISHAEILFFVSAIAVIILFASPQNTKNPIYIFATVVFVVVSTIYSKAPGALMFPVVYFVYYKYNNKWPMLAGLLYNIFTVTSFCFAKPYFDTWGFGQSNYYEVLPIPFVLSILIIAVPYFSKLAKPFIILSVLSLLFLTFKHIDRKSENQIRNFKTEQIALHKFSLLQSPNPIKANPNRPLQFMETPVTIHDPMPVRLGTGLIVLGQYLKMLIIPYPMGFYYGFSYIKPTTVFQPMPLVALLAYILLMVIALLLLRKHTILSFSIIWYLASIAVFSGLLQPVPGMIGDRYLFIPSLGICLALSYAFFIFSDADLGPGAFEISRFKTPVRYAAIAILLFYSFTSFGRNFSWKDRVTLFTNDIEHLDKSAQAHNLLAIHLARGAQNAPNQMEGTRMMQEAITHFKKALEIYPGFFNVAYDLGRSYTMTGQYDSAIVAYKYVLAINDTFTDAAMNIGILLDQQGKTNEAISYYEKVIKERPQRTEAYTNISFIYFKQKNFGKAIEVNKGAIKANPKAFEPYANIGKTYINTNNMDSAFIWFEKAYEINPNEPNLVNTLYKLSLSKNLQEKAKFYYTKLNELGGPPVK
jgi:tetratricopeptide (TPR) repeat protein